MGAHIKHTLRANTMDIQKRILLNRKTYELMSKGLSNWLNSLAADNPISVELVEAVVAILDNNNFGVDDGVDFLIMCYTPVMEEFFNYGLIRDEGDCERCLNTAILDNAALFLGYIDRFYAANSGRYDSKLKAFSNGILFYQGVSEDTTGFLETLEGVVNAKNVDADIEQPYFRAGDVFFKVVLMEIMRQFGQFMNNDSDYDKHITHYSEPNYNPYP